MKSIQQHLRESLTSEAYFDARDAVHIPLNIIVSAAVTKDTDDLEEYCDDQDIQYCLDLGQERMSDRIYSIVKNWAASMHYNDHETMWEARIADQCSDGWTKPSKFKTLVKRSMEVASDDIGADVEPQCLPSPNDSIFSKVEMFATYSDEDSFGWLAIPKNASRDDVAIIKSMLGY